MAGPTPSLQPPLPQPPLPPSPLLLLMKGHPGSGKSLLARSLARELRWPLVDKDDVRDATLHLERCPPPGDGALDDSLGNGFVAGPAAHACPGLDPAVLNELSYAIMWRVAAAQLDLGLSVVVDCPLARPELLSAGLAVADQHGAAVAVLECRPGDELLWRARLEARAAAADAGQPGGVLVPPCGGDAARRRRCHKPASWGDIEELLRRYSGCWEYATEPAPRLVLDTTALETHAALAASLAWIGEVRSSCTVIAHSTTAKAGTTLAGS